MAINKNDFKNAEGNYEAKNALMDAVIDGVNTHRDMIISEFIIILRDLTLTGNQVVAGFSRMPKKIEVWSAVTGGKMFSLGLFNNSGQTCVAHFANGDYAGTSRVIALGENSSNHTRGEIEISADNTVVITWTKVGTGGTGNAGIRFIAHYHD